MLLLLLACADPASPVPPVPPASSLTPASPRAVFATVAETQEGGWRVVYQNPGSSRRSCEVMARWEAETSTETGTDLGRGLETFEVAAGGKVEVHFRPPKSPTGEAISEGLRLKYPMTEGVEGPGVELTCVDGG